ncbi:hypothetical protein JOB18_019165 [Solea senegalensis]|uniref:Reverse transcriptase domain-containing protein n=1 Tax=Solea senegalensis TaxID=28829 RepID=A0AAV6RSZ2_SOLSE|nr:hypothetical protein JOB18_019165 [Solea senegalensis]
MAPGSDRFGYKVLPHIAKEDQTGFVKGRNSCDNLRRLLNLDIIHLTQSRQDPALVLSLDAEKSFDWVEWSYLFYALEESGLSDNLAFVNWIRFLYNTPMRLRSDNFPLHHGNRQDNPLSPLLFDIAIEPQPQAVATSPAPKRHGGSRGFQHFLFLLLLLSSHLLYASGAVATPHTDTVLLYQHPE